MCTKPGNSGMHVYTLKTVIVSGTIKLEQIYVMEIWQPDHHNHLLPCCKDVVKISVLT